MITAHLKRIDDARSVSEVWRLHQDRMAEHGFDRLLYVSTRFRTERSLGDLGDALFLTNHPPDYARAMIEHGLIRHAPMLRLSAEGMAGARSWRRPASPPPGTPARLHELSGEVDRRMGVVAGYDVIFPEVSSRAGGAIALCARPGLSQDDVEDVWDRNGVEIELVNRFVHRKISDLPSWGSRRPLTRQQHRVLQWVAEGKTAQEIGIIMSLTAATVEKHLRLAREALNVATTTQAVIKAANWNQLFTGERPYDTGQRTGRPAFPAAQSHPRRRRRDRIPAPHALGP